MSTSHYALSGAMTVDQLIDELKTMPRDAVVGFISEYGDRSRTQQFLTVMEVREADNTEYVAETAYSNSGLRLVKADDPDDVPTERLAYPIVLLNGG